MNHQVDDPEFVLSLLRQHGYSIDLELIDDAYRVTLNGKYAVEGYTLPTTFSTDYTTHEVVLMNVGNLLHWSGMKLTTTLTY